MGAGQLSLISAARRLPGSQRFDTTSANLSTPPCPFVLRSPAFPYSLRGWIRCSSRKLQARQGGPQAAGT